MHAMEKKIEKEEKKTSQPATLFLPSMHPIPSTENYRKKKKKGAKIKKKEQQEQETP